MRYPGSRRPPPNRILCPFCKEKAPKPQQFLNVFSSDGCFGERCSCGAAYTTDQTGRLGGQAVLDAQAVLCNGDLDQATALQPGTEVEAKSQRCGNYVIHLGGGQKSHTSGAAKAWFVRRIDTVIERPETVPRGD